MSYMVLGGVFVGLFGVFLYFLHKTMKLYFVYSNCKYHVNPENGKL